MESHQTVMEQWRKQLVLRQCLLFVGIFLIVPGAALTGTGNSSDNEFFQSTHRPMRIIGPILLSTGLALVFVSCCLCYIQYVEEKELRSRQAESRELLSPRPIVSGFAPIPMGQQHPVPPQQQTYPQYTQQGTQPPGGSYQYPAPATTQQPYPQYAPTAPLNPTYPPTATPSAPAPIEADPGSAPPPPYETVVDQKPKS